MEFDLEEEVNFDFLDNEEEILDMFSQADSVIFLVDVQSFHFQNEQTEISTSKIVANAYVNFLKGKLLANNSDRSSLIFFNSVI